MSIPAQDKAHLEFADEHTTPVVTYVLKEGKATPVGRGTGVLVQWHGRHYVLTNTHVMESFLCWRSKGLDPVIQVKGLEGEKGIEEHNGYLLMPHRKATIANVPSDYDHRDVGLIELKPKFLASISKRFLSEKSVLHAPPSCGDEVFFKGFPSKSAEFHSPVEKVAFGTWIDFRRVASVHDRLILTTDSPERTYRDSGFDEDGMDMHGTSGSGVFNVDHQLVGLVTGGNDGTFASAIYIVPSSVIIEVLGHYEQRQYGSKKPAH